MRAKAVEAISEIESIFKRYLITVGSIETLSTIINSQDNERFKYLNSRHIKKLKLDDIGITLPQIQKETNEFYILRMNVVLERFLFQETKDTLQNFETKNDLERNILSNSWHNLEKEQVSKLLDNFKTLEDNSQRSQIVGNVKKVIFNRNWAAHRSKLKGEVITPLQAKNFLIHFFEEIKNI